MGTKSPRFAEVARPTNIPDRDAVKPLAYNIPTFCRVMGFGRSKTYDMIKEGKLRAIHVAGRTLIPASEAQRLIAEAY